MTKARFTYKSAYRVKQYIEHSNQIVTVGELNLDVPKFPIFPIIFEDGTKGHAFPDELEEVAK